MTRARDFARGIAPLAGPAECPWQPLRSQTRRTVWLRQHTSRGKIRSVTSFTRQDDPKPASSTLTSSSSGIRARSSGFGSNLWESPFAMLSQPAVNISLDKFSHSYRLKVLLVRTAEVEFFQALSDQRRGGCLPAGTVRHSDGRPSHLLASRRNRARKDKAPRGPRRVLESARRTEHGLVAFDHLR
jgi:hypothetical protein